MKKFLAIFAIAASMFAVSAQAQNSKSLAAAKSALDKAAAAANNPKQNTKLATWLKYGQALMDAYAAPAGNMWVGMTAQDLAMVDAGERMMSESQVVANGQFGVLLGVLGGGSGLLERRLGGTQALDVLRLCAHCKHGSSDCEDC